MLNARRGTPLPSPLTPSPYDDDRGTVPAQTQQAQFSLDRDQPGLIGDTASQVIGDVHRNGHHRRVATPRGGFAFR